jgi:ferredoxin-NADP reductase
VVSARPEGTAGRSVVLRLPPGTAPHVPGQHYVVRVPRDDGSWAQRSYSVSSAPERGVPPDTGRHIELTVELLDGGELSPYLHHVAVGETV